MSSFQDLGVSVHNNPEAEAEKSYVHVALNDKTESSSILSVLLLIYALHI